MFISNKENPLTKKELLKIPLYLINSYFGGALIV